MPKYNDMDMYDEPMTDQDPREAETSPAQEKKDEEMETESALLPKSICPGMKPGDEMVLKIDEVTDNEYVVSYAPKPKGEPKEDMHEEMDNELY